MFEMDVDMVDPQAQPHGYVTPQSEPLTGQIPNSVGGYTYEVPDIDKLKRFLCLGTENRYYKANTRHSRFNPSDVRCIDRLIQDGRGEEAVACIRDVSIQGRSCKQDTVLYALATCAKSSNPSTKRAAFAAVNDVCRIPTFLFQFIKYCKEISEGSSGWGRAHRMGISNWYNSFSSDEDDQNGVNKLAYLVTKYKRRHGFTHRDVIRLAHLRPKTREIKMVMQYALRNKINSPNDCSVSKFLKGVNEAHRCSNKEDMCRLIVEHSLVREHVPNKFLNEIEVWEALLREMPFTAMLRNLGKMSRLGVLDPNDSNSLWVTIILRRLQQLNDVPLYTRKIHPLTLLIALKHYERGTGHRGRLHWTPNIHIVNALKEAFERQTKMMPSTGKSYLMAVSLGRDMKKKICGSTIKASEAAAAMVLSTVDSEDVDVILFTDSIEDAHTTSISRGDNLASISAKIASKEKERQDLAVPFKWSADRKKKYDVIIVLTDSLTSGGHVHPVEMLRQYLQYMAVQDCRIIVVAMAVNKYTVASPADINALDVIGFDLHTPQIIRDFVNNFEGNPSPQNQDSRSDIRILEEMEHVILY